MSDIYTYCHACQGPLGMSTLEEIVRGEHECHHCGCILSPNRTIGEVIEEMKEVIDGQAATITEMDNGLRAVADVVSQMARDILRLLPEPSFHERNNTTRRHAIERMRQIGDAGNKSPWARVTQLSEQLRQLAAKSGEEKSSE